LFQSVLPTIGPGALQTRADESTLYGTENEKQLFIPSDKFWQQIAEECAEEGIGVNMFLGNSKFVDVASIGMSCISSACAITNLIWYRYCMFHDGRGNIFPPSV